MRIVAAEIPHHRDHLVVALALAAVFALGVTFAIVMIPRRADAPRALERARGVRVLAIAEAERRRAIAGGAPEVACVHGERAHVCRAPDRDDARAWFAERVRPILEECAGSSTRGTVTLAFDEVGIVKRAELANVDDDLVACAAPKLARLAHPDAFEMTLTWPFALP